MDSISLSIIQPELLIDEKIIILLIEACVTPPKDPIIILKGINHLIIILHEENRIIIGMIFCKVINRNKFNGGSFIPISGVHKWRGAIPLFNINARGGTKA